MRIKIVASAAIISLFIVMAQCQNNRKADFQKARDDVKNFGRQNFNGKKKAELKSANTKLNEDIKKLKRKGEALDSDTKTALRKSLKGLKDRFTDLTEDQKLTACETMADSAGTKGSGKEDFDIRNQGCAKLGSSLEDKKLKQFGEGNKKRIRKFSRTKDLTQSEFTFGKSKMSVKLLKEVCGEEQCSVLHEELEITEVTISGKKVKGAQRFSVMDKSGKSLSKKSKNKDSKVELTFEGACPAKCLVAPGDTTDFKDGDDICTTATDGNNCVLSTTETSTYVLADVIAENEGSQGNQGGEGDSFSFRSIGYWFLGIIVSVFVIVV